MRGVAAALLLLAIPPAARAGDLLDLAGLLDVRWVHSDATLSYLEGGAGTLRFDPAHEGVRLGEALLAPRVRVSDIVTLHAAIVDYGDYNGNGVNLSELYADVRPFPTGPVRFRVRAGAFFLPVSLENRDIGWNDVYTITPAALNSWIGEELRTIGAETEARWLGASRGYDGDVALVTGVYGWNDDAGVVLAQDGFALTDRYSTLFGGLGRGPTVDPYHDIDHRPGYYSGLSWRHHSWLELRALRYDNLADPTVRASEGYAWHTRFDSYGARFEPSAQWTCIVQYLDGDTTVGPSPGKMPFHMPFHTVFALGSFEWRRERLSVRFDDFETHQTSGFYYGPPSNQTGHAVTLGWTHRFGEHWQLAAEWIRVTSRYPPRLEYDELPGQIESQTQVAVRYRFHLTL